MLVKKMEKTKNLDDEKCFRGKLINSEDEEVIIIPQRKLLKWYESIQSQSEFSGADVSLKSLRK